MAAYRVVAPYVTLKLTDQHGGQVLTGLLAGAVVSNIDAASLRHHLDNGMVEEVDAPAPVDSEQSDSGELDEPASGGRPSVRAPKEDWVAYAVSQRGEGVSEDDARAVAEGTSKADLLAQYGG